jgi:hypothetical protein
MSLIVQVIRPQHLLRKRHHEPQCGLSALDPLVDLIWITVFSLSILFEVIPKKIPLFALADRPRKGDVRNGGSADCIPREGPAPYSLSLSLSLFNFVSNYPRRILVLVVSFLPQDQTYYMLYSAVQAEPFVCRYIPRSFSLFFHDSFPHVSLSLYVDVPGCARVQIAGWLWRPARTHRIPPAGSATDLCFPYNLSLICQFPEHILTLVLYFVYV